MYFRHLPAPCSLPSATEFLVTKWSHWNPSLTLQRKGRVRCIFLWTLMVLSWIVSVHKLHRRVCPSCHNYRGFSAKKNMFLPDIIKDNSDSLEKTRGLDYMGFLFMLLLKLSLCLFQQNYLSGIYTTCRGSFISSSSTHCGHNLNLGNLTDTL